MHKKFKKLLISCVFFVGKIHNFAISFSSIDAAFLRLYLYSC